MTEKERKVKDGDIRKERRKGRDRRKEKEGDKRKQKDRGERKVDPSLQSGAAGLRNKMEEIISSDFCIHEIFWEKQFVFMFLLFVVAQKDCCNTLPHAPLLL